MKALLLFTAWLVLLAVSWPLALIALILMPLLWLLSIPLLVIGIAVSAVLALIKAVLFLPARMLGYRP